MVVGRLLRLVGHGEHDDASYIPDAVKHGRYGRDCIDVAHDFAVERGWMSRETLEEWRVASRKAVDLAQSKAGSEPAPDPFKESWSALSSPALSELYGA